MQLLKTALAAGRLAHRVPGGPGVKAAAAAGATAYAIYNPDGAQNAYHAVCEGASYVADKALEGVTYVKDRVIEATDAVVSWATGAQPPVLQANGNIVPDILYAIPEERIQEGLDSADRDDRNGRSRIGRSWEKKGGREGSAYPKPKGTPEEINRGGRDILEEILRDPEAEVRPNRTGGEDIIDSRGRGARFDSDGEFDTLLEP